MKSTNNYLRRVLNNNNVFIDPVCNFGNLRIFANPENYDLATDFINAIFQDEIVFNKIVFEANEFVAQSVFSPAWIFAAAGKSDENHFLILEMENKHQDFNLKNRPLYVPHLLSNIIIKDRNADEHASYETFSINILNFIVIDEEPDYIISNKYAVEHREENFKKIITLTHIELPKFNKSIKMLESRLDKWLYALKHMKNLHVIPVQFQGDTIFEKLFELAKMANLTADELKLYNSF